MPGMVPPVWDIRRVRKMLAGDRDAGERWVVAAYPRVYRMLRCLTGDSSVAEDLTQQTFVQAWKSLGTYAGASALDTWLHRIAYHVYTHWLRDRRHDQPLGDTADVMDRSSTDGLTTILVQQALSSLPDDMRETFILFYVQQMSVREIGGLLGVPAGTVKSRLFATRRRMRDLLSERAEGHARAGDRVEAAGPATRSEPIGQVAGLGDV